MRLSGVGSEGSESRLLRRDWSDATEPEADDVRVVESSQRLNLVLERGDVIHALQVQFLDGAWIAGVRRRREEHGRVACAQIHR